MTTQTKKHKHKRKTKHNKTFKKLKCAPKKGKQLSFTCYSPSGLEKFRLLWNSRHPDKSINTTNSQKIWEQLRNYMVHCCSNERQWLKHNFIKHNISKEFKDYTFAPDSPELWEKNPNEWLSSLEILNVMKQYEHKYKDFEFLGPSPIDYDTHMIFGECVWDELCNFNLKNYIDRDINYIGIVYNLDPHYKEGSHWVALFINIPKQYIVFFDSYGEHAHRQIKKFIHNVYKQGRKLNITFKKRENKKRHQYSETECGMYCLFFIISLLKGHTPNYFENKKITDKKMLQLRNEYFN